MRQISEVQAEIERLARLIDAEENDLPTYGYSEQSGRAHIEVDGGEYHYVVAERGHEFQRLTTRDIDELLYQVFQSATHALAFRYELQHRIKGQDGRRSAFPKQIELLSVLSNKWAARRAEEIQKILHDHPFDDNANGRAILWGRL